MGDLNMNLLKINQSPAIQTDSKSIYFFIILPTNNKTDKNNSQKCDTIDNISTSRLNEDDLSGILHTDLSDHSPIFTIKRGKKIK